MHHRPGWYSRRDSNPQNRNFEIPMSAVCITGAFGGTGGIRTRTVLHLKQVPPANWATVPRIFKEQNARRPVSHSGGAGLVEQQFRTEAYISNPEHTPLSSSSSSCNWAFSNSRFVFIRFLNPFFLPLGQTGAKYITTLPPPSTGNFVLHGWLRESDSNRCASGYEPAAGAAPVHPAILRTTY